MPFDPLGVPYEAHGVFGIVDGQAFSPSDARLHVSLKEGVSTVRAQVLLDEADAWHVSHFSTCPHAQSHRRPPAGSGPPSGEQQTLL